MQSKSPDSTREKILDAAYGEIYRHGYQAASIANILAKTGLTKGALYHHFPAKHDLGLAVIDEVIRAGMGAMVFEPLAASDDPFAALLEVIRRKGDRADKDAVVLGCPLNNLIQEMSPLDGLFKDRLLAILNLWQESIVDVLRRAQAQGRVRADLDVKATALYIVASWEGCVSVAKNLQSVKAFRVCMQQLYEFVQGLQVPVKAATRRRA